MSSTRLAFLCILVIEVRSCFLNGNLDVYFNGWHRRRSLPRTEGGELIWEDLF